MCDDVPDQVRPYLDEIADRLWSNNAAVMVGSGFSRNAKPKNSRSATFPSWRELGDIFYEKLHRRSPSNEARYLSLLKLAEQIQATFGRPALDELLRRAIPNLDNEPSSLHGQLLSLPWEDVFTTNYDTLLERARATVTLKHYDVVVTKEDLLYANQPRIVKLHGSFPSPPFVISEEDYRRFPTDHAPFVNTVRQSLLENTLCLVGFSSDDPNFLQWIGWMRDQLGQRTMPKIYLIGVFHTQTEADRMLLDERGITTVDLSGFSKDHGKALGKFLEFLKRHRSRAADWPTVLPDARSWSTEADPKRYSDIAAEWRRQRLEYPGWVVMPEDRRRILWHYTERWLWHLSEITPSDRAELEASLDLDLAFELGWRLERCLFPLAGKLPAFLEDVAGKYSDSAFRLPENTVWTKALAFEAVANIRLWLLRHYREDGLVENWENVRQEIDKNFERLLPEQKAKLRLEEALHALFQFDLAKAKQLLANWQINETLPFWEAKRAALMAELGETAAAHSILESSLAAIRQQLSLSPVMGNYTLVSQESVVMLLLWAVERDSVFSKRDSRDSSFLDDLSERWNDLTRYKCDPRREISSMSARLQHKFEGPNQEKRTSGFDLGTVSRKIHFLFDEEIVTGYGMLRMYEEIGMPYRTESTTFVALPVKSTLPRIRNYSPHWALTNIVRLGEAAATDGLFDREFLANLRRDDVDSFMEIYLPAFERTISAVDDPDWSEAKIFKLLAETLPEVFSRLCYKCSPKYRESLLDSLGAIYGLKRKHVFQGVDLFEKRLFDSMSVEERAFSVPKLLNFPMLRDSEESSLREFTNPLLSVNLPTSVRDGALSISVSTEKIDELLNNFSDNTGKGNWTKTSLMWLHSRNKLNQNQTERLGELLWEGFEESGVPVVAGFYCFACLKLPHSETLSMESRVKDHLRAMIEDHMEDSGIDDALDELRFSASMVNWTWAEVLEIVAILSSWWERNKHNLHYQSPMLFGSPAERTKKTISKAIGALSMVIFRLSAKQVCDKNNGIAQLREFLAGLDEHDIPAKRLEVATLGTEARTSAHTLEQVAVAMLDVDKAIVFDSLEACRVFAHVLSDEESRSIFEPLGTMLAQGVKWRHRPELANRLRIAADMVRNLPWFLSEEVLSDMLAGLGGIAEETSGKVRANDEEGIITIRACAGTLAFALFKHYQESGTDQPDVIRLWREICCNLDEFSEVRNSWWDAEV